MRTPFIEGEFLDLPEEGYPFEIMNYSPLNPLDGNARIVSTSLVKSLILSIDPDSGHRIYRFNTLNSEYMLEVYGKMQETPEV